MPDLQLSLEAIRTGGKPAVARALKAVETAGGIARHASLLDTCVAAWEGGSGHVLGLTGPPGVGKSTLTNALHRDVRAGGQRLAILAVDPSSQRTHGALLGDRTRLKVDPEDAASFVRSMAAKDRLGGLSDCAIAATALFAALYDRVIVESVGIGQSESDVAMVADTLVLCIQPGSGDSLQFMKAGVMEIPDIIVVTKADMGEVAARAVADVEGALSLGAGTGDWNVPVIPVSSARGTGMDALAAAIEAHRAYLQLSRSTRFASRKRLWVADVIRTDFGRRGLEKVNIDSALSAAGGPFAAIRSLGAGS